MTLNRASSDVDTTLFSWPLRTLMLVTIMKLKGFGRRRALQVVDLCMPESCAEACIEALTSTVETLYPARTSAYAVSDAWRRGVEDLERATAAGVDVVAFHEEDFPPRLRFIPDPPAVLYVRGKLGAMCKGKSLAVVGMEEPTPYGRVVARRSAEYAVENGFSIVSGLARGCDTYAHTGCVEMSGVGVGVLGTGLDRLYPASNRGLAERLLENEGCLVSEYALGTRPTKWTFAERDRIQSGLSDGVLVIETDVVGGTMHTVRYARQQNRPLACIFHPEKYLHASETKGNQKLQQEGWAIPVSDRNALLEFFDLVACPRTTTNVDLLDQ